MYQQFQFIFRCNILSRDIEAKLLCSTYLHLYGLLRVEKTRHETQHTIIMSKFLESKDL